MQIKDLSLFARMWLFVSVKLTFAASFVFYSAVVVDFFFVIETNAKAAAYQSWSQTNDSTTTKIDLFEFSCSFFFFLQIQWENKQSFNYRYSWIYICAKSQTEIKWDRRITKPKSPLNFFSNTSICAHTNAELLLSLYLSHEHTKLFY